MNLSLGLKIKELRKTSGLNQTQMAKELGVHLQTISRYERGELEPGPEILSILAEKFNVDANFLLKCQDLSKTLPTDTDFIILEHHLGYSRPDIRTKEEAIDRVVRILEKMSEERVQEVLTYAEDKNELIVRQSKSRMHRNSSVPVIEKEENGKKK